MRIYLSRGRPLRGMGGCVWGGGGGGGGEGGWKRERVR